MTSRLSLWILKFVTLPVLEIFYFRFVRSAISLSFSSNHFQTWHVKRHWLVDYPYKIWTLSHFRFPLPVFMFRDYSVIFRRTSFKFGLFSEVDKWISPWNVQVYLFSKNIYNSLRRTIRLSIRFHFICQISFQKLRQTSL